MILRTVRVDLSVDAELDDARSEWPRVDDAWSMIEWVLSRDPTVGEPQTESGHSRSFVFQGSIAHEMPDIQVLYVFDEHIVDIKSIVIRTPKQSAGNA